MRPLLTPWYQFGRGVQRTLRRPYLDIEVQPVSDGWMWRVTDLQGNLVGKGRAEVQVTACGRAMLTVMDIASTHQKKE